MDEMTRQEHLDASARYMEKALEIGYGQHSQFLLSLAQIHATLATVPET